MLLGFKCKNFRSIKDEQELTMFPGPIKNLEWHLLKGKDGEQNEFNVLKCALLFGANASGKSNLFKAMRISSQLIINNIQLKSRDKDEIKRAEQDYMGSFKFDDKTAHEPSMFEYEIESDSRLIKYGFEINNSTKEIISEWFKEFFVKSDDRLIFLRGPNGQCEFNGKTEKIENTELFIHKFENYSGLDPDSILIKNSHLWFRNNLAILKPNGSLLWDYDLSNKENRDSVARALSVFDTGINGMDLFDYDENDGEPFDIVENIRTDNEARIVKGKYGIFETDDERKKAIKALRFTHGSSKIPIRLDQESDGTLRLMRLSPILIRDDKDCVYVLDEIDRYLHPSVVYAFLEWFLKKNFKSNKQLIIITHNPHLLDQDLVRRDEIWFAQKNNEGGTELYSLDQFNVRFDKKIEKAYYGGYFDGIPRIVLPGDIDDY